MNDGMDVNLILVKKNGAQKVYPMPNSVTVIGRRRGCDLRIPIVSVSKKHCQLNYDDNVLRIRDLGSHNGTVLNGQRIKEAAIQPGDCVEIGPVAFVFQINGQPKDVAPPKTLQKSPQEDKPKKEMPDEQFASFEEISEAGASKGDSNLLIDDSDSLENNADLSLDDSDILK